MEIRDFEKKMKYAMDFYDQATEIQHMVHDSIRGFHYLYGYDLYNEREVSNPELASLVERRKRQLLIEMGRVGEYSIKYLLLMEQMLPAYFRNLYMLLHNIRKNLQSDQQLNHPSHKNQRQGLVHLHPSLQPQ